MWRLPGLLCRALNRFHAPNFPGYVHGEAEALSPSSLIPLGQNVDGRSYTNNSSSQQTGQNGQDQKKRETYKSFNCQLPHYSVLDVFGWGAAAVAFLQLARHACFQSSATNSPREDRCAQRSYLQRILQSLAQAQAVRSHILPKRAQAGAWNDIRLQEKSASDEDETSTESTGSASSSGSGLFHSSTEEDLHVKNSIPSPVSFIDVRNKTSVPNCDVKATANRRSQEVLVPKDDLGESLPLAATKLLDIVENSVPVVLNISGIISARDRADYKTAFHFFRQAADGGYSKAQYNTGVCYEQGRGVEKDINKAAAYYLLAGKNGHKQAKYRYARCILQMQSEAKLEDIQTAVQMLNEAAGAGLKEAQAYLGVLYCKEPFLDPQKAVRYLWMAAENGDIQSRYYLGLCFEKGFGVPANRLEARRHYERVAEIGHGAAQQKLNEFHEEQNGDLNSYSISLKAAASSPCLPVLERVNILAKERSINSASRSSAFGLPHSMSTGNLLALSQAASSRYSLAPVQSNTAKLKIASLKVIGVG
ncbi:DAP3-binding cell death enhancer 1 isoform X2 [Xenopus laevis]|uniref:DAP3-binding cell death enhancer 1 isoform X2 n=1 Tax=Xenopus laevis TaxID=8355 RepID=A0A8J0UUJ1_XENLA|nr:DAP3-binding cell death enhancer 1 isoform X2 [Xenopus laevis]